MAKNLGVFIFLAGAPCSGSISVYIAEFPPDMWGNKFQH